MSQRLLFSYTDCVACLAVPCQNPIPQSSDTIWVNCLACLQRAYPPHCSNSAASCANYLIGLYSGSPASLSCCSDSATTLLLHLQQTNVSALNGCDAATYNTATQVGLPPTSAVLPYVSSNGQDLQFIIPHLNLSCHGCFQALNITMLEAVSSDSSFDLQLWKRYTVSVVGPSVVSELYLLNASVSLTVFANWLPNLNVYSFPLDLCFSEGDVVGIQLHSNSLLRIATDNLTQIYARSVPDQCTATLMRIFAPIRYVGSPKMSLITAPKPTTAVTTTNASWLSQTAPVSSLTASTLSALLMMPSSIPINAASSIPSHVIGPVVTTVGVLVALLLMLASAQVMIFLLQKKSVKIPVKDTSAII